MSVPVVGQTFNQQLNTFNDVTFDQLSISGWVLASAAGLEYPGGNGLLADADGALYYSNTNNPTTQLTDNQGDLFYGNGQVLAGSDGEIYYNNGVALANSNSYLQYGNGNVLADNAGRLYYGAGEAGALTDTALNVYLNNSLIVSGNVSDFLMIDNNGSIYYANGSTLADASGTVYYGNGEALGDSTGKLYSYVSTSAPSTASLILTGTINVTGTTANLLGHPRNWLRLNLNGVDYSLPCY